MDSEFTQWICDLKSRYHRTQVKAAIKVNSDFEFCWTDAYNGLIWKDSHNDTKSVSNNDVGTAGSEKTTDDKNPGTKVNEGITEDKDYSNCKAIRALSLGKVSQTKKKIIIRIKNDTRGKKLKLILRQKYRTKNGKNKYRRLVIKTDKSKAVIKKRRRIKGKFLSGKKIQILLQQKNRVISRKTIGPW